MIASSPRMPSAGEPGEPQTSGPSSLPRAILQAMRPNQWTKNLLVMAAYFFSLGDLHQPALHVEAALRAIGATVLFCAVSSAIYLLNDIRDLAADRAHPLKKHRPIAAGRVPLPVAWTTCAVLMGVGVGGAALLDPMFLNGVLAYVGLQIIYSFGLKQVALVDILVISAGFVLRAICGAVVLGVSISAWLLLCTFLLALFLALCKRRHEKILTRETGGEHRPSLEQYDIRLLDQLIGITGSSTIVCYAMYTLAPGTVDKFGTRMLGFTVPFVVFGIFRYLDLVYRHAKGDRPERILLTDLPILADLILYGLSVGLIFWLGR